MRKDLPIGMIEVGCTLTSELEVLMLVLPNRDVGGSMDKHISRLEDGI